MWLPPPLPNKDNFFYCWEIIDKMSSDENPDRVDKLQNEGYSRESDPPAEDGDNPDVEVGIEEYANSIVGISHVIYAHTF